MWISWKCTATKKIWNVSAPLPPLHTKYSPEVNFYHLKFPDAFMRACKYEVYMGCKGWGLYIRVVHFDKLHPPDKNQQPTHLRIRCRRSTFSCSTASMQCSNLFLLADTHLVDLVDWRLLSSPVTRYLGNQDSKRGLLDLLVSKQPETNSRKKLWR